MKARVIRDPIYGYITLPSELAVVVDDPLYQRLRRISQTSLTSSVYPTATGTRFEHGLGAMHLAILGFQAAWKNARDENVRIQFLDAARTAAGGQSGSADLNHTPRFVELLELAVGGAALLHDLGHPPFSHVLESVYESLAPDHLASDPDLLQDWNESARAYHEFAGCLLTKSIVRDLRPDLLGHFICEILDADENSPTWAGALHSIVAGEVDVDRLDYVMRDAKKAGTEFGAIDYVRLVEALELHEKDGKFRIAPGLRARSAVETLLLQRTQAYKWITYHPRVVGANLALTCAVELFRDLAGSDEQLGPREARHPASDVFGPRWPDLNYLIPAESDLTRRFGTDGDGGSRFGEQLQLDDQDLRELVADLRYDMQASIDDSTVLESLKSAGLLAKALLASGEPSGPLREHLVAFLTFQQHALVRMRNCLPAWKTVDEFDGATAQMKDAMARAIEESYESVLAERRFSGSELAAILSDECMQLATLIRSDPAIGINRVLTEIFDGEQRYLDQFGAHLGSLRKILEGIPGVWKIAYTGFTSIRQGEGATVLFDGSIQRPLYESSKLAQALFDVEAARPRLAAYFFVAYPNRLPTGDDSDSRELREKLTGDVVNRALPDFVQMILPTVIKERFAEVSPRKGGPK